MSKLVALKLPFDLVQAVERASEATGKTETEIVVELIRQALICKSDFNLSILDDQYRVNASKTRHERM